MMLLGITLLATLPTGILIYNIVKEQRLDQVQNMAQVFARSLAHSIENLIYLSGGDIRAASVDAYENIKTAQDLTKDGLVYADAVLLSRNPELNGIVITRYHHDSFKKEDIKFTYTDKIPVNYLEKIKSLNSFSKVKSEISDEYYYRVLSLPGPDSGHNLCVIRLYFSEEIIITRIRETLNKILIITTLAFLAIASLGYLISLYFSYPISLMMTGVAKIKDGDLNYKIPIKRKDEIGVLSDSFNTLTYTLKEQFEKLKKANLQLQANDRIKDELITNLSHELKNPLSAIIGISESLTKGVSGQLPENVIYNLNLIKESAGKLTGLINDILDLSLLKHENITLDIEEVDLYNAINSTISLLSSTYQDKDLAIINKVPRYNSCVYADRRRLYQILLNIIGNAVKFTEKGKVVISSATVEDASDKILITVEDTGIGISGDQFLKIFDSFYQSDIELSKRFGGSGIGLTIAKQLIELHGGFIDVDSTPGRGAKFHFSLPGSIDDLTETTHSDFSLVNTSKSSHKKIRHISIGTPDNQYSEKDTGKILIASDDPIVIQVIANHLLLEGYSVESSDSAESLLLSLDSGTLPDLIILDFILPGISGYELCREIRKLFSAPELPVLILTEKTRSEDIIKGIEAGANDYVAKPLQIHELLVRVKTHISLKNSFNDQISFNLIQNELTLAREIQQNLLPEKEIKNPHLKIYAEDRPEREVGGDYYDYYDIDEDLTGVLIADITGHGIPAAYVSAILQTIYNSFKELHFSPELIIQKLNSIMSNYTHYQFASACYAVINTRDETISWCNAGHTPLLIYRRDTGNVDYKEISDRPLGVEENSEYQLRSEKLRQGDRIVLYTDCVTETRNPSGKLFGVENLIMMIKEYYDYPPEKLIPVIEDELLKWMDPNKKLKLKDDLTILIIDYKREERG